MAAAGLGADPGRHRLRHPAAAAAAYYRDARRPRAVRRSGWLSVCAGAVVARRGLDPDASAAAGLDPRLSRPASLAEIPTVVPRRATALGGARRCGADGRADGLRGF